MEANKISLKTFAASIASIFFVEALFRLISGGSILNPLATLGLVRCLEAVLLVSIAVLLEKDPGTIGLMPARMLQGFMRGLIWSAGFGIIVGIVYLVLLAAGINVLLFLGNPYHSPRQQLFIFFLVGGVIGPIAEEIFFRGIIYGYFRKWGAAVAVISSTLLFVFLHPYNANLPVTQAVGGLIFAVAYEKEKSLFVPITIHCLGNFAIFSIMIFI
jgi:membrane protease YdiL (CAAX protease family)